MSGVARFLEALLIVTVGSRTGTSPQLPSLDSSNSDLGWNFDRDTLRYFRCTIGGLRAYAKTKQEFVVNGLLPQGEDENQRAAEILRAGVGFPRAVSSVKILQVGLNPGVVPYESVDKAYRVDGYGFLFHDTVNHGYSRTMQDGSRRPHLYTGLACGTFLGPDAPQETNHNPKCREKYADLSTCKEIAGVNLNPHEQNHSRKAIHLSTLNNMIFSNFTSSLRVINEVRNVEYNRKAFSILLRRVGGHPQDTIVACLGFLSVCGRCFCKEPVMRVFDQFGRVYIVDLDSVLRTTLSVD